VRFEHAQRHREEALLLAEIGARGGIIATRLTLERGRQISEDETQCRWLGASMMACSKRQIPEPVTHEVGGAPLGDSSAEPSAVPLAFVAVVVEGQVHDCSGPPASGVGLELVDAVPAEPSLEREQFAKA
jgi:hypothetical protein